MNHLILIGDSIFDNRAYVESGLAVVDQVRQILPSGWRASLLAVDGDTAADVVKQLKRLPPDASHLVLSVGGNDALRCLNLMGTPVSNLMGALDLMAGWQRVFQASYAGALNELLELKLPLMVCTVYDRVPGMPVALKAALSLFNDVIVRESMRRGLLVLDLRAILTEVGDYSVVSPIEPSSQGGKKLANEIVSFVFNDKSKESESLRSQ